MHGSNSIVLSSLPHSTTPGAFGAAGQGEAGLFGVTLAAALPPVPDVRELRDIGRNSSPASASDAGEGARRRRPAEIDLSALAVAELASREDRSPSASVQEAQAVLRQDQQGGSAARDRGGAEMRSAAPTQAQPAAAAGLPAGARAPEAKGPQLAVDAGQSGASGRVRQGAQPVGNHRQPSLTRSIEARGVTPAHVSRVAEGPQTARSPSAPRSTGPAAVAATTRAPASRDEIGRAHV